MGSQKMEDAAYNYVCNPDTRGNRYKSAVLAGYSETYARGSIKRLFENAFMKERIKQLQEEKRVKANVTLEEKIEMAWQNYQEAISPADRKFWWEEHGKLSGDYVQRTQNKNENTTKIIEEEYDFINDQLTRLVEEHAN